MNELPHSHKRWKNRKERICIEIMRIWINTWPSKTHALLKNDSDCYSGQTKKILIGSIILFNQGMPLMVKIQQCFKPA